MKPSILIINGPGLDDLSDYDGNRYGGLTLTTIREASEALCTELEIRLDFRQTEDQDEMFQWIKQESEEFDGVIINPAGYSRSATVSPRIYRSAIQVIARRKNPVIEIHTNNIYRPGTETTQPLHEPEGNMGFICGFGLDSYLTAIRAVKLRLESRGLRPGPGREMADKVIILNGPNLNLLGRREPDIYGRLTLDELSLRCKSVGLQLGLDVQFRQSNHEGALVDWIQEAIDTVPGLIINAAAYTHTSVAIHDALRAYPGLKIELHISNPQLRETFRHISFVSPVVDGIVVGLGTIGYELVVELMANLLSARNRGPKERGALSSASYSGPVRS